MPCRLCHEVPLDSRSPHAARAWELGYPANARGSALHESCTIHRPRADAAATQAAMAAASVSFRGLPSLQSVTASRSQVDAARNLRELHSRVFYTSQIPRGPLTPPTLVLALGSKPSHVQHTGGFLKSSKAGRFGPRAILSPDLGDPATWTSSELGNYLVQKTGVLSLKEKVENAGLAGNNMYQLRVSDLKSWGPETTTQARVYSYVEDIVQSKMSLESLLCPVSRVLVVAYLIGAAFRMSMFTRSLQACMQGSKRI
jgi:hypothetical protein